MGIEWNGMEWEGERTEVRGWGKELAGFLVRMWDVDVDMDVDGRILRLAVAVAPCREDGEGEGDAREPLLFVLWYEEAVKDRDGAME